MKKTPPLVTHSAPASTSISSPVVIGDADVEAGNAKGDADVEAGNAKGVRRPTVRAELLEKQCLADTQRTCETKKKANAWPGL